MVQDGILLYCSQSKDGQGDFASITLKDGRVEFRFDTGSGPAILRSGVPINAGAWYKVSIERKLRDGKLTVSTDIGDEENKDVTGISTTVTGKSPGSTRGLNIRSSLYFGGMDEEYILAEGVGISQGFDGCITDLTIGGAGKREGSSGSRHRGRGMMKQPPKNVEIAKSVVDSSNVLDCSLLNFPDVDKDQKPQQFKGMIIFTCSEKNNNQTV